MSESTETKAANNNAFPLWAKALLVCLVVVVAVQSWLISRVASEGEALENDQAAQVQPSPQAESPASVVAISPSPGFIDADPWWAGNAYDPASWDPFYEMQRMRERMDRLFGEALGRFQRSDRFASLIDSSMPFTPQIDVRENEEQYRVTVNLPGLDESNVEVDIEGQVLRIRGETQEQRQQQADNGVVLRRERRLGSFERVMTLPEPVEGAKLSSSYEDGVLQITIPKVEASNAEQGDSKG